MADQLVKVSLDKAEERQLRRYLKRVEKRLGNTRPIMAFAVGVISKSAQMNFRAHGRDPFPWPPLKDSTVEAREKRGTWPGWPLVEFGTLQQSLLPGNKFNFMKIENRGAEFGTVMKKGHGLNFGVPSRNLAARPFLYWRDEDIERIISFASIYSYSGEGKRARDTRGRFI